MWQLRCIVTWGRPTPRQPFSPLTVTPVPRLKSVNLSVHVLQRLTADILHYAVILSCDPLTLNICSVSADDVFKLCTKF